MMLNSNTPGGAVPPREIIIIRCNKCESTGRIKHDSKINMRAQEVWTKIYTILKSGNVIIIVIKRHFALRKTYIEREPPSHF